MLDFGGGQTKLVIMFWVERGKRKRNGKETESDTQIGGRKQD
jgi:hypothetical protein